MTSPKTGLLALKFDTLLGTYSHDLGLELQLQLKTLRKEGGSEV
jgi:hypothetical protein